MSHRAMCKLCGYFQKPGLQWEPFLSIATLENLLKKQTLRCK